MLKSKINGLPILFESSLSLEIKLLFFTSFLEPILTDLLQCLFYSTKATQRPAEEGVVNDCHSINV